MAGRKSDFTLTKLDDLFTTQAQRDEEQLSKIRDIPLELIDDFPDHPFKVRDDEDMMQLVESVKERGVITPATVRQKEDGRYELVSGHRRKRACELAGFETLRSEIVDLNRDEATILMVESNFQRSEILPSEKAFAYKIIQPLKVLYKSMSWYLKAYCTEKQDYRIFKLTRIITLEMLSDTFDKKSFPELDEMSGQVYSTIVLRFAKEISYRVYDEFDNTQISTEENGDLIVSVEMPEDEWLIGYLLSFGTQVDIVEPAHLKDIVAKQAKSIYEKYKS